MIPKIELFLFILSLVFCLKHIGQVVMNVVQENPKPIKITTTAHVFMYVAVAYVFTYITSLFI